MAKVTRIHPERRVRRNVVELQDHQEVTEKMDHRAWVTLTFTCPYCHATVISDGDMQLPTSGRSTDYTIVTTHTCKREI